MFGERTLAALTALLLLFAGVSPAIGATVVDAGGPTVADHDGEYGDDEYDYDNESEAADEAYVDGEDVVLVYQYDESDERNTTGHVATNVSEGLAYVTATDEDAPENVTYDATMVAEPDRFDANGTLSAPAPDNLTALDVSLEQTVDDSTAESDFDLSAAVAGESDSDFEAMRTSGFVESAGESVTSNGSVTFEVDDDDAAQRYSVVVTEGEDSYEISFEESYAPEDSEAFEDREAALQTLQERFCGGMENNAFLSCSVDLERYEFTGGEEPRVDLGYTVTYEGLKSTIESMGPMMLSSADNVSMDEASRIVGRLTNVTVDRVAATVEVEDGTTAVTWNASVTGTDDLALVYADVLEIVGQMQQRQAMATGAMTGSMATPMGGPFGGSPNETAEQLRDRTLAQRAADMTRTMTWDASVEATADGGTFEVSADSTAENWGAYVDELQARDGPVPPTTNVTADAGIDGDRIVVDGVAHVQKENLFTEQFDSMDRMTARMDDEEAERFTEMVAAVENASFQRARADVTADGETVTMEGAVAAENAAALTAPLPKNLSAVASTYTDLDERTTYVRLDGAVGSDATEEEVRALALVDENTTVAFEDPGEPSMDVPYVRSYLGLAGSESSGNFPTVMVAGGAVAVTAAAGGGLLLLRGP